VPPTHIDAYYYYARTRFHQGDLDGAATLFRKAADTDPADYQSRCLRVLLDARRYCTDAQWASVATIVSTSYCATISPSWFVTSVSQRTSP